jgi:glycosyltransferase involved in cell wall biosynthesis
MSNGRRCLGLLNLLDCHLNRPIRRLSMHIGLIAWYADRRGGADVYTECLATGLVERGYDVTLICYEASAKVKELCRVVPIPKCEFQSWPIVWRFGAAFLESHWTRKLTDLANLHPDMLVFTSPLCQQGVQRSFPKVPAIYMPHSRIAPLEATVALPPSWFRCLTYRHYHHAERRSLLQSVATVRFTPGAASLLSQFYSVDNVRYEIIPQAISPPANIPPPRRGPTRVVNVARLIHSKNLQLLIQSIDLTIPGDWHVDIIGDGESRTTLERMVLDKGLASRVTFHGHQDDPSRFYAHADLLAFPSFIENVSLVVLEAMAHGTIPLVIRADGQKYQNTHDEIIRDGIDGFIANDEPAFTRQLRQYLTDADPIRQMSFAAAQTATNHYWSKALDRWENLLNWAVTSR